MAGAAMLSAVVGGLAYGTAKQQFAIKEAEFQELAVRECMANDPYTILDEVPKTNQDMINHVRRLETLHDICNYGMGRGKKHAAL